MPSTLGSYDVLTVHAVSQLRSFYQVQAHLPYEIDSTSVSPCDDDNGP